MQLEPLDVIRATVCFRSCLFTISFVPKKNHGFTVDKKITRKHGARARHRDSISHSISSTVESASGTVVGDGTLSRGGPRPEMWAVVLSLRRMNGDGHRRCRGAGEARW